MLAVGNDRHFGLLCEEVLQRADLAADARFATNAARLQHRDTSIPLLEAILRTRTAAQRQAQLQRTGIPTGTVRSVGEALRSQEAQARQMVTTMQHPNAGALQLVASPIRMSGTPVRAPTAPPMLGEHTEYVLSELLGRPLQHVPAT